MGKYRTGFVSRCLFFLYCCSNDPSFHLSSDEALTIGKLLKKSFPSGVRRLLDDDDDDEVVVVVVVAEVGVDAMELFKWLFELVTTATYFFVVLRSSKDLHANAVDFRVFPMSSTPLVA